MPMRCPNLLTPLNQLSTDLKNMSANSTITTANSKATFNAAPNANSCTVFSRHRLGAADGPEQQQHRVQPERCQDHRGECERQFRRKPSSANWNVPELPDVIFNFYSASTVSVGNWEGAISGAGRDLDQSFRFDRRVRVCRHL